MVTIIQSFSIVELLKDIGKIESEVSWMSPILGEWN